MRQFFLDTQDKKSSPRSDHKKLIFGILILILSLILFLPLLNLVQIYDVGEGREGTVVHEMLNSGNYILPLRNGNIVPSKPMMFHWLDSAAAALTGSLDLFTLRLPSALAGVGTVMIIWWLACSFGGVLSGNIAAIFLLTTLGFFMVSTEGRVDSVFRFFVTLAIAIWVNGLRNYGKQGLKAIPGSVYHYVGIALGFAVLTKGPLGIVMVCSVIGGIAIIEFGFKSLFSLIRLGWIWGIALPLPWYIAATFSGKENFIGRQVVYENFRRLIGGEGIHQHSYLYYFPQIFRHGAPWSFLFVIMLFLIFRYSRETVWKNKESIEALGIRVGIMWFVTPFIFLTLSAGKHGAYLDPLMPGMCLACALWMVYFVKFPDKILWLDKICSRFVSFVVLAGPLVYFFASRFVKAKGRTALILQNCEVALAPKIYTITFLYLLFSFLTLYFLYTRAKRTGFLYQWGPVIFSLLFLILGVDIRSGRAIRGVVHCYKNFAEQIAAAVPDTEKINWILPTGKDERLGVGRDDSFDALFFYLNRHVQMLNSEKIWEEPGLYVARKNWIDSQTSEWKNKVKVRAEGGKLDDDPGDQLVLFDLLAG